MMEQEAHASRDSRGSNKRSNVFSAMTLLASAFGIISFNLQQLPTDRTQQLKRDYYDQARDRKLPRFGKRFNRSLVRTGVWRGF